MENSTQKIFFQSVKHGSEAYKQTVALRRDVLRIPLGLDFTEAELSSENDSFHLALWREGEMVACLILKPVSEKSIKMRQVAVSKPFQNQGLGKLLVAYAEAFAKSLGFAKIELHAREAAVRFYLKQHGYAVVGDVFEEVGLPHFKMEKALV